MTRWDSALWWPYYVWLRSSWALFSHVGRITRAEKRAQWLKCLVYTREGLSLGPAAPCKSQVWGTVCHPGAVQLNREKRNWVLSKLASSSFSERAQLKEEGGEWQRKTPEVDLWPWREHKWAYSSTPHTQKKSTHLPYFGAVRINEESCETLHRCLAHRVYSGMVVINNCWVLLPCLLAVSYNAETFLPKYSPYRRSNSICNIKQVHDLKSP